MKKLLKFLCVMGAAIMTAAFIATVALQMHHIDDVLTDHEKIIIYWKPVTLGIAGCIIFILTARKVK